MGVVAVASRQVARPRCRLGTETTLDSARAKTQSTERKTFQVPTTWRSRLDSRWKATSTATFGRAWPRRVTLYAARPSDGAHPSEPEIGRERTRIVVLPALSSLRERWEMGPAACQFEGQVGSEGRSVARSREPSSPVERAFAVLPEHDTAGGALSHIRSERGGRTRG